MSLILQSRLLAAAAMAVAVWLAWRLALEDYLWPAVAATLALGGTVVRAARVPVDTLVLGTLLFGYLVGNRGFAQLTPTPNLPLFPAEIGLLIAGAWLLVRCAHERTLPFQRDLLNGCVGAWLLAGTIRVGFDVRPYGLDALRDYAMIYYAGFFFIAQHAAHEESRRFLLRALLAGCVLQPMAAGLVELFPDFFLSRFVLRGVPLIYFKGDLALTFTAVSGLLVFLMIRRSQRSWAWPLATAEFFVVLSGANRASMLGAMSALAWLARSRARRFAAVQLAVVSAAVLVVAALALLTENAWAQRKFAAVSERVASVGDFMSRGNYLSEESGMKGDNNRFRMVWWRTVVDDTWRQNPVFGLGFGYDLARNFVMEYNPDLADEFTARSPHSIVMSTFGRMGLVGLIALILLMSVIGAATWRVVRDPQVPSETLGLWVSPWIIFVSACFGVVLEGPMGAVVFWTLLGLASARTGDQTPHAGDEVPIEAGAALPPVHSRGEVMVSTHA